MRVFAISDLHLSTTADKPMSIFGDIWENHFEHISLDWQARVKDDDLVLIAGDISWAMYLEDAMKDLQQIANLPGKKVIIRGNHDYWWSSYSKIKEILPLSIFCVQNNAIKIDNYILCGTRGWYIPEKKEDEEPKYINRELIRLELSLKEAQKLQHDNNDKIIVMMHYPPFNSKFENTVFTDLISSYGIKTVVYGHLHGKDIRYKLIVNKTDTNYYLTSCDILNNKLLDLTDHLT